MEHGPTEPKKQGISVYGEILLVFVLLTWAYWPPLIEMTGRWTHDPQYSHGYLVPVFSMFILWLRRKSFFSVKKQGSYWGIVIILGAITLRIAGTYFYFTWLDPISLLPMIAGIVLLFGGWQILRYAWPAIAFLFYMIPLPYNISISLAAPLQRVATEASTFLLQVFGCPAVAEGNVILLNEFELGVVEACSGLRMLVVFFAISTAVAMFLKRPVWEKSVIVASALPIAIVANVLRITVTGVLYETAGKELAELIFHDLAGWLMMPLALALLVAELFLIDRLLINNSASTKLDNLPKTSQVYSSRIKRNRIVRTPGNQSPSSNLSVSENTVG